MVKYLVDFFCFKPELCPLLHARQYIYRTILKVDQKRNSSRAEIPTIEPRKSISTSTKSSFIAFIVVSFREYSFITEDNEIIVPKFQCIDFQMNNTDKVAQVIAINPKQISN